MNLKELFNAANLVSFSRVPTAVIMVIVYENKAAFFALLALAIISDALDGYIARKTGATRLGAVIDPLCDKIFVAILVFFLLFSGMLSIFQLSLILIRDFFVVFLLAGMYFHPMKQGLKKHLKARWPGKIATVMQFVTIVWLFAGVGYFTYVPYAVALVSLAAIGDYILLIRNELKR